MRPARRWPSPWVDGEATDPFWALLAALFVFAVAAIIVAFM